MNKRYYTFFTFLFAFISIAKAQKADTLFYSFLNGGAITGGQKTWQTGPADYHYKFNYTDRGSGPSQIVDVKINPDGTIAKLNVSGTEYLKKPYNEIFQTTGDSASWAINGIAAKAKRGQKFYYCNTYIPGLDELAIKWLQKKPGNKGDLLPGGTLRITQGELKKITFKGKTASLRLVSIYKDAVTSPNFVWLDDKGRFFDRSYGWWNIIKKGYEGWADTLNNLEVEQQTPFYQAEINKYSANIPTQLLITNVNIFESETADVKQNMSLEVANGRIKAIYPTSAAPANFKGKVIDAKGKFLMPGLWDMHSHYYVTDGVWYLAGGVSHVRDMGNANIILTYQKQVRANQLLGPDISYLSGFIDGKGPLQGPTGTTVSSLGEALTAVREYHRLGFPQIKIYSSVDTGWVRPMIQEAHKLGMRASGHVPWHMDADKAIDDGYDQIVHMQYIFMNFINKMSNTQTPPNVRKFSVLGGAVDLSSPEVNAFMDKMREKNVSIDLTLNQYANEITDFKGDTVSMFKPIVSWMPESYKAASLVVKSQYGGDDLRPAFRKTFKNMLAITKMMYDKGIRVVPGTDGDQAIALHHELELYVQAGIPAAKVLKMATYDCAQDCNLLSRWGQIKPGMEADFILIDGDPTKNISDVRRVELVIKNNRQYNPKQLLASQGWGYYY